MKTGASPVAISFRVSRCWLLRARLLPRSQLQRRLFPSPVSTTCQYVADLERSAQFYQSLFGLAPPGADKEHNILRLGAGRRVIVSLRQDQPHGQIDHFGLKVEGFKKDAATQVLTARGFKPQEDWEYGYYIKDPDGAIVQML